MSNNLKEMKLSEITVLYNEAAKSIGEPTVKSFKDKETAIKRVGSIRGLVAVKKAASKVKPAKEDKTPKAGKPKKAPKSSTTASEDEDKLLGKDSDPKPARKPTGAKKAEKDLLGEDEDDEKPKKAKRPASKAPADDKPVRSKNSLDKGKEPTFDHPPFSMQKEPREKTFRAKILAMLESEEGTTVKKIEGAFQKYWDSKGITPNVDIHLRALEILRLLRYQNGFGFKEEGGRIFALRAPAKK